MLAETASKAKVTRLAAALAGFGLTGIAAWTLSSGLITPPTEVFSRSGQVVLSLPYRGFCSGLSLHVDGAEMPLTACDVRAGLARLSLPLGPGEHEVQLAFEGLLPGLRRDYEMSVVVDGTPPPLVLEKSSLSTSARSATTAESVTLRGKVEPLARLSLGSRDLPLDAEGGFSEEIPLLAGWNELLLRAEDRAGNSTTRKLSVFRDTRAPEVNWKTPPGHAFKSSKARLEVTIDDDGPLAGVTSKIDGKPISWHRKSVTEWLGMTPELIDGRYLVELKVADLAGRVTTSQREILIDTTEVLGEAELTVGARGQDVIDLHTRLLEAGYLKSNSGSVFTAETRRALENLQADEGLSITGIADSASLAVLGPRIVVNLGRFELVLERPGQPDRRWSIASGSNEFPTPTGRFVVVEKVLDPTWLPPDSEWAKDAKPVEPGPDNPLGTRWIGLDWGGVGIHGTNAPWTVGSAASHGCMRMETSQVEELFSLVEEGTPVFILGGWEDDKMLRKFWP